MKQPHAAQAVLFSLQAMGSHHSNPVLEVLDAGKPLLENYKYPENKLRFNNGVWRAYYHCHGEENRFDNEHGHFHIFHKLNDIQWAHVAGLSMDNQGQSQHWFTTNRWVTNESWQPATTLVNFLSSITPGDDLLLVEQWLLSMLQLYHLELEQLLLARDQRIEELKNRVGNDTVLENRDYYLLSQVPVNLLSKLETELVNMNEH